MERTCPQELLKAASETEKVQGYSSLAEYNRIVFAKPKSKTTTPSIISAKKSEIQELKEMIQMLMTDVNALKLEVSRAKPICHEISTQTDFNDAAIVLHQDIGTQMDSNFANPPRHQGITNRNSQRNNQHGGTRGKQKPSVVPMECDPPERKMVIKGIPRNISEEEIKTALQEKKINFKNAYRLRSRVKPNRRLQHVVVEGIDSMEEFSNFQEIQGNGVKVEEFREFPPPTSPKDKAFKRRLQLCFKAMLSACN